MSSLQRSSTPDSSHPLRIEHLHTSWAATLFDLARGGRVDETPPPPRLDADRSRLQVVVDAR